MGLVFQSLPLLWGVHTWSSQHKAQLEAERSKLGALYGNPFLMACDELQSRCYNILARENTLSVLRAHYPDDAFADETLYLIFQYFGWERYIYRYGPFSEDAQIIHMTSTIKDTFASSQRFPTGAFCFFRPEQRALGDAVLQHQAGEFGPEAETLSLFKFRQALLAPPLVDTQSVKVSLDALKTAHSGTDLDGRERLAQLQHELVDLVVYLEKRLNVSLSQFTRGKVELAPAPLRVVAT